MELIEPTLNDEFTISKQGLEAIKQDYPHTDKVPFG